MRLYQARSSTGKIGNNFLANLGLFCRSIAVCFDNDAVLLSVTEPETAEQNISTGCDLMRFGFSAGDNLSFPSVCWAGIDCALVHVVSDGEVGVERYGNKQERTFGPQVAESAV